MFNYSGRAHCYLEIVVKTDMSCGSNCFSPLSRMQTVQTSSADQNFQIKVKRKAQLLVFF